MVTIEIKTLIDITRTNVIRHTQGSILELDQHRNFTTLVQCAELRSVIEFADNPTVEKIDIKNLGFGSNYKGKHNVWTFTFNPDREYVYADDKGNNFNLLIEDIHQVPIIKNLKESINIEKSVFDCKDGQYKNIIIKALSGSS